MSADEEKACCLIFKNNMREFLTAVQNIIALEQGGKLSEALAFGRVKELYKKLKTTKKSLIDTREAE